MTDFLLIKRNRKIQHNFVILRLVVYKKAYDISRERSDILTDNTKRKISLQKPSQGICFFYFILFVIITHH